MVNPSYVLFSVIISIAASVVNEILSATAANRTVIEKLYSLIHALSGFLTSYRH